MGGVELSEWLVAVEEATAPHKRKYLEWGTWPRRPSTWLEVAPWINVLNDLSSYDYSLYELAARGATESLQRWRIEADPFTRKLTREGVISPLHKGQSAYAVISSDEARIQVESDGDPELLAQFDKLLGSLPALAMRPPVAESRDFFVQTVLSWTASGVVGNLAWKLVEDWRKRAKERRTVSAKSLTPAEALAFAEMLTGGADPATDLLLLSRQQERQARRGERRSWEEWTTWTLELLDRNVRYVVKIDTGPDDQIPTNWSIQEFPSTVERYDWAKQADARF